MCIRDSCRTVRRGAWVDLTSFRLPAEGEADLVPADVKHVALVDPLVADPSPPFIHLAAGKRHSQSARGVGSPSPLSLIHISEPTRLLSISYAVFCLKKKKK